MRAVIVGGGIAGPVLGMFLRKAGMDVVICEARDAQAAGEGAFLGLAPNGMNVLAALGLAEPIAALGHESRAFWFTNARGKTIGHIDQRADQADFGQRMVMIKRGVLHRALLDAALARDVRVEFSAKLSGCDAAADRVIAICEDGRRACADLLIGCDGLRSRTRALLFPDAPVPVYTGLLDFGGFTHVLPDDPLTPGWNSMVFGARAFFGAFVTAQRELWWFHNGASEQPLFELDPAERRARLMAEHAHDPAWIRGAIERTPDILGPWPLHVMPELSSWSRGRVCLIGDAAHATAPAGGQGASLALEDAMLLARCLRDAGEPLGAFASFERARRPRVMEIAAQSMRNNSGKANASALGAWLRDRMLPAFLKLGASAQRRAQSYRIEWT